MKSGHSIRLIIQGLILKRYPSGYCRIHSYPDFKQIITGENGFRHCAHDNGREHFKRGQTTERTRALETSGFKAEHLLFRGLCFLNLPQKSGPNRSTEGSPVVLQFDLSVSRPTVNLIFSQQRIHSWVTMYFLSRGTGEICQ